MSRSHSVTVVVVLLVDLDPAELVPSFVFGQGMQSARFWGSKAHKGMELFEKYSGQCGFLHTLFTSIL